MFWYQNTKGNIDLETFYINENLLIFIKSVILCSYK